VSRKGKASPLEAGRGKEFPTCEPKEGRGQVGWMPRLSAAGAGKKVDPAITPTFPGSPALRAGSFTAEAVKRQDNGSQ